MVTFWYLSQSIVDSHIQAYLFPNLILLTYQASIDQDLKQIGHLLRNWDFEAAKSLYEEGSNSASYAKVFLSEPLQEALPAGSIVRGLASDGESIVTGMIHETVRSGERQLKIRYLFVQDANDGRSVTTRSGSEVTTQSGGGTSKQALIRSTSKVKFSEKSKRHRDDRNQSRDNVGIAQAAVLKDHYCYVGGSPEPVTDGCKFSLFKCTDDDCRFLIVLNPCRFHVVGFKTSGTLTIDALGRDYGYTYNILNDNKNARSISKLSKQEDPTASQMLSEEFSLFSAYFGRFDFADHIIQTAFASVKDPTAKTEMERNNLYFDHFDDDALASFTYTLMAHMTIWLETVVHFDAVIDSCPSSRQEALQQWDEAVSLYLGSRGNRKSILQYDLAAKLCQAFRTCAPDSTEIRVSTFEYAEGEIHINQEIAGNFESGRNVLMEGDCDAVKPIKAKIVRLMTIPLIQATLLEAYKVARNTEDNFIMGPDASAIAYGLTILPLIHACNEEDAITLAGALGDLNAPAAFWTGSSSSSDSTNKKAFAFKSLKQTLEKNYSCMKIKCSDVGGIWNFNTGQYMNGAEPCDANAEVSGNDDARQSVDALSTAEYEAPKEVEGIFLGLVILAVAGLSVLGLLVYRYAKEKIETKRQIEANRNLQREQRAKYCRDANVEITLEREIS